MKKTKWMLMSAIMLTLAVTFSGCSDDSTSSSDSGLYFHVPFPDDSYFDRVDSISLAITAADIDSPITAIVPDSLISGETQLNIRMNVPAGDARHYDLQAYDSDDQCLFRNQGDFDNEGRTDISIILRPNGMGGPSRVKLFRNFPPFNEPSQPESILVSLGFSQGNGADQYQVLNSSQMASVVLSPGIDLVILQAMQDTIFYQDYVDASASFDEFVQDGGAMLFFYTASNFDDSISGTTFPAGVEFTSRYNAHNDVIVADHPITVGLEQELDGGYLVASTGYFSNLPANSLVLTAETAFLVPTMFVFSHGNGTIILSSQPLEYFRRYRSTFPNMGGMLSRVIRFMLGYDPTPGEIPGPILMPPGNRGNNSSAISASER